MAVKTERIEARFLPEIKQMAERAALASGTTLTDYLARLVREDAPKTLKAYSELKLSNQEFDRFVEICEQEHELGARLKQAAQRLDKEGF